MPWQQVSPSKYERSFDGSELLVREFTAPFKKFNQVHWAVSLVVEAKFSCDAERIGTLLRQTWIKVRHLYPMVAALQDEPGARFVYECPKDDDAALQKWLEESFIEHQDDQLDEFLASAGISKYGCLHYFPRASTLVFRMHHLLIDGTGILHFANRFFEVLSQDFGEIPAFGDEWKRLPNSIAETAGWPRGSTDVTSEEAQAAALGTAGKLMSSIGLPAHIAAAPQARRRVNISIGPETLSRLLSSCKEKSFSLTSAVHAAIAAVTCVKVSQVPNGSYNQVGNFDYRRYMPAPYNDHREWPMGWWVISLPFETFQGASFLEHARNYQQLYTTLLTKDHKPIFAGYDQFCIELSKVLAQPMPSEMKPPTQPMLTNWGIFDDVISQSYQGPNTDVQVQRIEPLMDVCVPSLILLMWTWKGSMNITACYNDAYYWQQKYVELYLTEVKTALIRAMGVA